MKKLLFKTAAQAINTDIIDLILHSPSEHLGERTLYHLDAQRIYDAFRRAPQPFKVKFRTWPDGEEGADGKLLISNGVLEWGNWVSKETVEKIVAQAIKDGIRIELLL